LKIGRRFGGTCYLQVQSWKIHEATDQHGLRAELAIFFDPEDGGDMFLRKVGRLSKDYTALYPRR
jgi:hypothetical protein